MNASSHIRSLRPREFRRIVCLTEETVETLYRIGEEDRIVGISTFVVRPRRARLEKPVVSQFTKAKIGDILELRPDLVLAFSDLQAEICASLIREGIEVHCFNHRSIPGILGMIRTVGALVGASGKADRLNAELLEILEGIRAVGDRFPRRPRVYFEEWPDPLITGIRWVGELIEVAGGTDCFADLRGASLAKDRILDDPARVLERDPDLYLASWCGRKFRPDHVARRPGWSEAPFHREGRVYEIDSALILQPGPAALTEGVWEIHRRIAETVGGAPAPPPAPFDPDQSR